MTYDDVTEYAKKIGISFTRGDVEEILEWAREDNETDIRYTVWEWLDTFEGISHRADPEFFADEYSDTEE